ncbi:MAG: TOBE domain-containing protein, partial [Deltaproteobacteria bacterium]|nr:TOBE domain-containing protein [Deltaproteobacteria bacterium]
LELKKINRSIGVTTLYVTHDQAEALSLGDKVCVMHDGEIIQMAPPHEVYAKPASLFVARFVGEMNFVKGHVAGPSLVECPLGALSIAVPPGVPVASPVTLAIRPEHVHLNSADAATASLTGGITSKNYLGDVQILEVEVNGVSLLVKQAGDTAFTVGQRVNAAFPADRWHVYPQSPP